MSEWKPIETAPKTGQLILIGRGGNRKRAVWVTAGYWDKSWNEIRNAWGAGFRQPPTHWMPLPEPPK